MIQIEDNDLPITVAAKLITAQRKPVLPFKVGADMFDDDDLRKIADYLYVEVGRRADMREGE